MNYNPPKKSHPLKFWGGGECCCFLNFELIYINIGSRLFFKMGCNPLQILFFNAQIAPQTWPLDCCFFSFGTRLHCSEPFLSGIHVQAHLYFSYFSPDFFGKKVPRKWIWTWGMFSGLLLLPGLSYQCNQLGNVYVYKHTHIHAHTYIYICSLSAWKWVHNTMSNSNSTF